MIVRTKLDENVMKEKVGKKKVVAIILLCFSIICFLISLPFSILTTLFVPITIIFLCLIVVSIVIISSYNKTINQFGRINKENIYTFFDEYIDINTMSHGEIIQSGKLYYSDIFKIKETKNYFFLYINQDQAFPILKENIEDISKFTSLIYNTK